MPRSTAMRMAGALVLVAPLVTQAVPRGAPQPAASAAADAAATITAGDLARHIEILASDAFEGREPGTAGETKTLDYLTRAFARLGVAPGNGGSYLQRVPLVALARTADPTLTIRGDGGAFALAYHDEFMADAGGPSTGAEVRDAPVVFAGYGIQAPEYDWDDYAGVDVRGAIVVVLRAEPGVEGDSTFFRGRDLTIHGVGKGDLAARLGARALVTVHTDATAGYPWATISRGGAGNTQMFLAGRPRTPPIAIGAQVSEPAARRLLAAAHLDLDDLTRRAGTRGFRAIRTGLTASLAWRGRARRVTSHNVVASIAGASAPDECVVYTAHWDHVGRNRSLAGDQIFNGAVDNATGTAGLLEIAEAYRRLSAPPRRSVYFVATTAEEKGLKGAEYYAQHPICPLSQTVAVLNLDAHFPYGPYAHMATVGLGLSELDDVLRDAAGAFGRVLDPDPAPEAGAFYRADTYPFVKLGVPALFSVGGPGPDEPNDSPVNQRLADYLEHRYHRPADEYDAATWDLAGVVGDVRVYFETGRRLADSAAFPNWRSGTEFRTLRDAMRRAGGAGGSRAALTSPRASSP